MEQEHLVFLTAQMGERLTNLAKTMGKEGRQLNPDEMALIKLVKYQYLQSLLREATMFWLMDNMADFHEGIRQAQEL